jgi:hypothetical protein
MPSQFLNVAIFVVCLASASFADDFKTPNGKEYKNAAVTRVEPDGVVIKFHGGVVKIPFTDLNEDLRRKYNYDPDAARQFAAGVQRKINEQNQQIVRQVKPTPLQASERHSDNVELTYYSPEELGAKAHNAAREKMFSAEEEKAELSKIPAGGALSVSLYGITIGTANTKWLTYVIGNSAGDVLERKTGSECWPSYESEYRWRGFDWLELPAFEDSLRVRVYHEVLGNLGDYVVQRSGGITRVR